MVEPARVGPDSLLRFGRHVMRAAIGRGGTVAHKQEGDGATPRGVLQLRRVLYRADRIARPSAAMLVEPIAPEECWCDDPRHRDYNTLVRLPHDGRCEALWRRDAVYDLVGVLGWNDNPVRAAEGSAIFLHAAQPDYTPTEGCVALSLADLLRLLAEGVTAIEVS